MIRRLLLARRARRAEALPGTTCYSPADGLLFVALLSSPIEGRSVSVYGDDGVTYRLFHLDYVVHRSGRVSSVRAGDVLGNCPSPEGPVHHHAR